MTTTPRPSSLVCLIFIAIVLNLTGCSSAYYGALESVGIPKREVMKFRVEKARDSQEAAKEQFQTALQRFTALTEFDGGDLEDTYNELQSEYDTSVSKAEGVRKRISEIEDVSGALFEEWEEEIEQYSSASLRRNSEKKLQATRKHYAQMIGVMNRAETKIEPVLSVFKDHVMYLKHNLNARAIASLKDDLSEIESDVASLIKSMESSIDEANQFIATMESG